MGFRQRLGKMGEDMAVHFLQSHDFKIIERNFRCPLGEVDIIAVDGSTLVFIEVKTRSSYQFGLPQEAVNYKKQVKLRQLANYYIKYRGLYDMNCRFDVISVMCGTDVSNIEQIKNAF